MVAKAAVVLLDPQAHITLGLSGWKSVTEAQDFVRVSVHVSALLGQLPLALQDFLEGRQERFWRSHLGRELRGGGRREARRGGWTLIEGAAGA